MTGKTMLEHARDTIDPIFAEYVGPIFIGLCGDETKELLEKEYSGPGAVYRYISKLAEYIEEDRKKASFKQQALKAMFPVC